MSQIFLTVKDETVHMSLIITQINPSDCSVFTQHGQNIAVNSLSTMYSQLLEKPLSQEFLAVLLP